MTIGFNRKLLVQSQKTILSCKVTCIIKWTVSILKAVLTMDRTDYLTLWGILIRTKIASLHLRATNNMKGVARAVPGSPASAAIWTRIGLHSSLVGLMSTQMVPGETVRRASRWKTIGFLTLNPNSAPTLNAWSNLVGSTGATTAVPVALYSARTARPRPISQQSVARITILWMAKIRNRCASACPANATWRCGTTFRKIRWTSIELISTEKKICKMWARMMRTPSFPKIHQRSKIRSWTFRSSIKSVWRMKMRASRSKSDWTT